MSSVTSPQRSASPSLRRSLGGRSSPRKQLLAVALAGGGTPISPFSTPTAAAQNGGLGEYVVARDYISVAG